MGDVYTNFKCGKQVQNFKGSQNSDHNSLHREAAIKTNLTELLQALTQERNHLKTSLTEMSAERKRLQCLCKQKKTCPPGWTKFWCSCYLLSTKTGSWATGREDCRTRGGDLVVIDSIEEQTYVSKFTNTNTWIGLSDSDEEGTWEWVDETPLTVKYWSLNQPDNGNGLTEQSEEDCVYIIGGGASKWRDYSCEAFLLWMCEKPIQP
ncbi:asialoglycoprotein receptor 2-like [Anabas testudineus]|uniref:asialoglycoprotein receptor 2-like n=1 Tax=Anabas testudineus TaxID=64144 RepID=UPI000E45E328|nr:asialoglycoprotein receptor 2-like [Anabas testudineus]